MSRPVLLLTLLALTACGPTRAFLKEGREAAAAQDWARAYRAYDHVLERKPAHPEALRGRAQAQDRVLAALDEVLSRELQAGRLDRVRQAIDEAARVDAPADWRRAWEQRWSRAWVERLTAEAEAAERRRALGEAWVWREALVWFTQDQGEADRAWTRLREAEWPGVQVTARGAGSEGLVEGLRRAWAGSDWSDVPLGEGPDDTGWRLALSLTRHTCETAVIDRREAVHRYTDGTLVPNPRVAALRAELAEAERSLSRAEAERDRLQLGEDRAYDRLQQASRAFQAALPALEAAERALADATRQRQHAQQAVTRSEQALARLDVLDREGAARRGEIQRLRGRRQELEGERVRLAQRLADAEPRLAAHRERLQAARDDRQQAQAALEGAQGALEQAQEVLVARREALAARGLEPPEHGDEAESIEEIEARIVELEAARDEIAQRLEGLKARLHAGGDAEAQARIEERLPRVEARLEAAEAAVQEAREELAIARFVQARRARRLAGRAVREAEGAVERARGQVEALRPVAEQSREEVDRLKARLAEVDQGLERTARRLERLRDEGAAALAEQDRLAPIAGELEARRRDFRRMAQGWRLAEVALARARDELDRRGALQQEAERVHAEARAFRVEAASVVADWADRRAEIRRDLEAEPARVELVKQATHTIARHRRTCRVEGRLSVTSPLAGTIERPLRLQQVDEDDTNPARPRIRLSEDPLRYDTSEGQTLSALDARATALTFQVLSEQVAAEADALRRAPGRTRDARTRQLALADHMQPTPDLQTFIQQRYDLPGRTP